MKTNFEIRQIKQDIFTTQTTWKEIVITLGQRVICRRRPDQANTDWIDVAYKHGLGSSDDRSIADTTEKSMSSTTTAKHHHHHRRGQLEIKSTVCSESAND